MSIIKTRYPPATEEALQRFEKRIGGPLPSDYRLWLKSTNGGRPEHAVFYFGDAPGDWSVVGDFFPIGVESPIAIEEAYEQLRTKLPPGFIAIAHDPVGSNICLGYSGRDLGRVFFYNDVAPDFNTLPSPEDWLQIASSFERFVNSLRAKAT